jgi:outer membrane protein assembly factor BamB
MKLGQLQVAVLSVSVFTTAAADWPQWRGPARNSISTEQLSGAWPENGPKTLWRAVVGTGFSSLAVSRGRVCTMGNSNNQDTVWCLDARTGKELWRHDYASQLGPQWYEGGPAATPTLDGERVFTISKWGNVFCLDIKKGTVLWSQDLRTHGIRPNRWGFAGSPLVWHDLVILNAGDAGTALNRDTGSLVWHNGTNAAGYASPTLFRSDQGEAVLIFAAKDLVALDPGTGRELWRYPFKTDWDTNNSDPLVFGDSIFISSFSHGCALLSVKQGKPEAVYESKVLYNHLSPPLLLGEHLYGFSGEAKKETDLRCIHLPSGELKWTRKEPAFGSLISAGGRLLVLSEKGELLMAEASASGFEVKERAKVLGGTCWTPPALADGLVYVRNAKGEVRCLELSENR